MLTFMALITSENETVKHVLSMFVNKLFDLIINLWYVCYLIPRMISCFAYNLSHVMLCLYVVWYDVKWCYLDLYLCKYLILYWSWYICLFIVHVCNFVYVWEKMSNCILNKLVNYYLPTCYWYIRIRKPLGTCRWNPRIQHRVWWCFLVSATSTKTYFSRYSEYVTICCSPTIFFTGWLISEQNIFQR